MEKSMTCETDLNLKATELRLGLPGSDDSEKQQPPPTTPSACRSNNKRAAPEPSDSSVSDGADRGCAPPPAKSQVVGWPPIRSYRKNSLQQAKKAVTDVAGRLVKVVVDGAPYLRKIDLKVYGSYSQLIKALEEMFKLNNIGYSGSDYCPTYEDKDGDWMLVGDVPWEMFMCSCKRLRIMKGSEDRC